MFGTAAFGYYTFGLFACLPEIESDARTCLAKQPDDFRADAAGSSGDESHFAMEG